MHTYQSIVHYCVFVGSIVVIYGMQPFTCKSRIKPLTHNAGDSLRIDEETLDRQHYIVTVMQTKESGRVPKEFVTVGEFPWFP